MINFKKSLIFVACIVALLTTLFAFSSCGGEAECEHVLTVIPKVEPTCTKTGLTEGKKCSVCDEILVKQEIIEAGHTYKNSYTCDECGYVSAIESVGLKFTINSATDTYTVTGKGTCTDINIVIPYTYNGKPVTSIGSYAFSGCKGLTSITIPNSVTSIESSAFIDCTSLTSITVDENNTKYKSIDGNLYSKDGKALIQYALGKKDTSFVIPNSVTSIEFCAFSSCTSLTSVTIPDSVTSIGGYAFYNCTSLTSVTIPDSVISIGDSAFYGCTSLTSVTIGDSVNSIGRSALSICTSLTIYCEAESKPSGWNSYWKDSDCPVVWDCNNNEIASDGKIYTVINGVRYCIKNSTATVTHQPSNIEEANIPESIIYKGVSYSVTSIGEKAFDGCTSLTSVTIGNSVTSIGEYAFYNCTSLTSITIPDSVTSIGGSAFSGCPIENAIIPTNAISYITKRNLKTVVINGGKSIENDAFSGYSGLTSITIGDSVTSIGDNAFGGCTGLTSINYLGTIEDWCNIDFSDTYANPLYYTKNLYINGELVTNIAIPNTITEIKAYAFYNCTSLTSVTIPDSVTSIGYQAFYGCTGLTSVTIGNSVTSIGEDAFYNCTGLTSINYLGTIEDWCNIDFSDTYANPLYYTKNLYINGELVTNIAIPNTITEIKAYAFYNCTSLTSVTIPDSVTSIGYQAFYGCTIENAIIPTNAISHIPNSDLKTVVINGGKSIENDAFSGCSGLTSITIGDSVTSIGDDAFSGCTGLTSVTIGDSVTSIGNDAFRDCTGLTSINYLGTIEDWCNIDFSDTYANPLYYAKNLYINGELVTSVTIGNSVTSIGYCAFYGCTSLTSITIPSSVTSIGGWAFRYCTSLTSITIPDSVTFIGDGAFYNCTGLTSVTIGDGVNSIGQYAFEGCTSLTSVTIPDSVTSIGSSAFESCASLTSVTIGNSVTYIGDSAFRYCTSLTSVIIGDSVTYIGSDAFSYCTGLTSITIPDSVTAIERRAFEGCTSLTIIYCEATSKPSSWISNWNSSGRPVVWGHAHEYENGKCVCGKSEN